MPNSFLCILKENHENEDHKKVKEQLQDLAEWDAIQLLHEGLLYDGSNPKNNSWGIESAGSFRMAIWCKHVMRDIRVPLSKKTMPEKLEDRRKQLQAELQDAIVAKGGIPKEDMQLAVKYLYSNASMADEEKHFIDRYVFMLRNQDLADNIKTIVGRVHNESKRDQVFALSLGGGHVDLPPNVVVPKELDGVRDLPTILGRKDLVVARGKAAIEYDSSLRSVVEKALAQTSYLEKASLYLKTQCLL